MPIKLCHECLDEIRHEPNDHYCLQNQVKLLKERQLKLEKVIFEIHEKLRRAR